VGTNDVRRSRNLDYVMGEVYDLVNTAKAKFPGSRIVLSGVLRSKGVKWRRVGAANDRLEWVARNLGAKFVENAGKYMIDNAEKKRRDKGRNSNHGTGAQK